MKTFFKKATKIAVILIFNLILIELVCFIFFTSFQDHFNFFDIKQFLMTPSKAENMKKLYDPELGWLHKYDTPSGERPRSNSFNKPLIAAFGDSYTHCDEVSDNETWEESASNILKADIYNFGVGGYGTDQAYLRFKREVPKIAAPIVTLGFTAENINRLINVYRPFYYARTGIFLTKPRFELDSSELTLLANPVKSLGELTKLSDSDYLISLGENDWWFKNNNLAWLEFPYIKILFNIRLWKGAYDENPWPWDNHWRNEQTKRLMFAIFDKFAADASSFNKIPVFMFLPKITQIILKVQGQMPDEVKMVIDYCKQKNFTCFDGIEALASSITTEEEAKLLFKGHLSARGNYILGKKFAEFIKEHYPKIVP